MYIQFYKNLAYYNPTNFEIQIPIHPLSSIYVVIDFYFWIYRLKIDASKLSNFCLIWKKKRFQIFLTSNIDYSAVKKRWNKKIGFLKYSKMDGLRAWV